MYAAAVAVWVVCVAATSCNSRMVQLATSATASLTSRSALSCGCSAISRAAACLRCASLRWFWRQFDPALLRAWPKRPPGPGGAGGAGGGGGPGGGGPGGGGGGPGGGGGGGGAVGPAPARCGEALAGAAGAGRAATSWSMPRLAASLASLAASLALFTAAVRRPGSGGFASAAITRALSRSLTPWRTPTLWTSAVHAPSSAAPAGR
eukprot:COSAG06_NODE_14089_length_1191_cov_3.864469_1_plen_207_part_00